MPTTTVHILTSALAALTFSTPLPMTAPSSIGPMTPASEVMPTPLRHPTGPAADAGFAVPQDRLPTESQRVAPHQLPPITFRLIPASLSRQIELFALDAAHTAWTRHAETHVPPTPLRLAIFFDNQLDIAAARAALSFTRNFSIGATLEVPVTELGYDLEANRIALGATFTF